LYVNLSKNSSLLHPNFSNAGAKIGIPFKPPNILLEKKYLGKSDRGNCHVIKRKKEVKK
jgi:hypothetical protein